MDTFGTRLRKIRIEKGLSQNELAEKIGCTQTVIDGWEKDKKEPRISELKKLCECLWVSANYLIGRTDGY